MATEYIVFIPKEPKKVRHLNSFTIPSCCGYQDATEDSLNRMWNQAQTQIYALLLRVTLGKGQKHVWVSI